MATGKKKIYTLSEALDYLDNLEVSSSDESEDEDDEKLKSAQIFIQPPVNCNDMNSDIDSGEENVADGDARVSSGNQLLGCAVLEMKLTKGKVVRGNDDEQSKTNDNQDLPRKSKKKKKKSKVKHINKGKQSDLPVIDDFEWNLPIPALESHELPSSLFEKFLTDDILKSFRNTSGRYAQNTETIPTNLSCMIWKPLWQFFLSMDMLIYPNVLCFGNVQLIFTMMLFLQWCQKTDLMR